MCHNFSSFYQVNPLLNMPFVQKFYGLGAKVSKAKKRFNPETL
jgi:hypothetical protein